MGAFDFLADALGGVASQAGSDLLSDELGGFLDDALGEEAGGMLNSVFGGSGGGGGSGDGGGDGWGDRLGSMFEGAFSGSGDGGGSSDGDSGGIWGGIAGAIDRFAGEGTAEGIWAETAQLGDQLASYLPPGARDLAESVMSGNGSWAGQLVDTAASQVPPGWEGIANTGIVPGFGDGGLDALYEHAVDLGGNAISSLDPDGRFAPPGQQTAAGGNVDPRSSESRSGELLDSMSDVAPTQPAPADPLALPDTLAVEPTPSDQQPSDIWAGDPAESPPAGGTANDYDDADPTFPNDGMGDGSGLSEPPPLSEPEPMDDFSQAMADAESIETSLGDEMWEGVQ